MLWLSTYEYDAFPAFRGIRPCLLVGYRERKCERVFVPAFVCACVPAWVSYLLTNLFQENAHLKEMTEEMLSGDHNPARANTLALEIDSASQEEIAQAYHNIQVRSALFHVWT